MRRHVEFGLGICVSISAASCAATHQKQVEQDIKQPIHCATAEGDIRALQHEKAHVTDQIAAGVTAIVPIGLVAGVATGTEGTKVQVATGEYNKQIDAKITEIKTVCHIR